MKAKMLILGLICLFVFVSCEKSKAIESPFSPKLPSPVLTPPTIISLTSSNPDHDRYITVSWEVENATEILLQNDSIHPLEFNVTLLDTLDIEVCGAPSWKAVTVTYSLIASNDDGSVQEDIEVTSATAILDVIRNLDAPVTVGSKFLFDLIVTETNGIGGEVRFEVFKDTCGAPSSELVVKRNFEPFETWSFPIYMNDSPLYLCIQMSIDDNNDFWTEPYVMIFCR